MLAKIRKLFGNIGATRIDQGVTLKRVGRDSYLYSEGDREMEIYVEMLIGDPAKAIYRNSIEKWLPPYDAEELSENDHERILRNVRSGFEKRGTTYEVV